MDTLHSVLRSIRGEAKASRTDHLDVFREFLSHLGRVRRRAPKPHGKAARARRIVRAKR